MTDWIQKHHENRCEGKQAYRKASLADEQAEKATHRAGELIISYQCYDCGKWHIGHADQSQILARVPTSKPTCVICKGLINEARLQQAEQNGTHTTTCSKTCARQQRSRRSRERRLAEQAAPPAGQPQN